MVLVRGGALKLGDVCVNTKSCCLWSLISLGGRKPKKRAVAGLILLKVTKIANDYLQVKNV